MEEKKEDRPPEIDFILLPEGTEGDEVLFVSEGLDSEDYDFGGGIWWG